MSTKTTKIVPKQDSKKTKLVSAPTKKGEPKTKVKKVLTQSIPTNVTELSRDQLAMKLTLIAKEERLVKNAVGKFKSHPYWSTIFTTEHLSSILNETMVRVINAVDSYKQRENTNMTKEEKQKLQAELAATLMLEEDDEKVVAITKIGKDLNLSTLGLISGYMKQAYKFNISKDYKKQTAKKNIGNSQTVSYDIGEENDEDGNSAAIAILNLLNENSIEALDDQNERNRILKQIFKAIRSYDKKTNQRYYQNKKTVNKKKLSKLAYLFLYLIHPKYQGKYVLVGQEKFGWTPYIFDKHKTTLLRFLKDNFEQDLSELLTLTTNAPTNGFVENAKAEKTENYNLQSCQYMQTFGEKYQGNTIIVSLICQICFNDFGKNGILQQTIFSKEITDGNAMAARSYLLETYAPEITKIKNDAELIRLNAVKEVYKVA